MRRRAGPRSTFDSGPAAEVPKVGRKVDGLETLVQTGHRVALLRALRGSLRVRRLLCFALLDRLQVLLDRLGLARPHHPGTPGDAAPQEIENDAVVGRVGLEGLHLEESLAELDGELVALGGSSEPNAIDDPVEELLVLEIGLQKGSLRS